MKKTTKKLLAVILAIALMLSVVPFVYATEVSSANIIQSYNCEHCSLSYTLYDDGTLSIDGNGSITGHQLSSAVDNIVTKVIISDTVTNLNATFLAGLKFLENIIVSENHPTFTTENGVLFNKDKTILHTYPAGKNEATYNIPDTVSQIGPTAFAFSKIKSITIPDNVIYIGWQAFSSSNLVNIKIENKDNRLFIAAHAFENCENLQTVDVYADQLYCISASSFIGTPVMNNETKWENGVLYLNDILLAVNSSEIPTEYTIKDGTKLIADSALFYYNYSDTNTDGFVKVTIPESVNNIGYDSICVYDSLPSNLIRLGVNSNIIELIMNSDELSMEQLAELLEWLEKYNGEFTPESVKNLPNDLYYLVLSYCDFIQYAEYGLSSELYIFDAGYRGIVDENQWKSIGYLLSYTFFFPTYTDGFIFQNDMELLSGFTVFNHETTEQWIAQTKYESGVEESLSKEKSLTFLNKDTAIYDSPITIWEGYTICGYPNSTAQKYAQKYNRNFVDITNCTHSETAKMISITSTCQREGYTGDTYCQYCGKLLENGSITNMSDHTFSEWETEDFATCTREGTEKRYCTVCDYTETRTTAKKSHDYSSVYHSYDATCTYDACKLMRCTYCWDIEEVYIEGTALGHTDTDERDGYCDRCRIKTDEHKNCSCNCHKSGIAGFFFDILIFFQRIFGINKQCSCGAYHY